jgi:hypothetical protein
LYWFISEECFISQTVTQEHSGNQSVQGATGTGKAAVSGLQRLIRDAGKIGIIDNNQVSLHSVTDVFLNYRKNYRQ